MTDSEALATALCLSCVQFNVRLRHMSGWNCLNDHVINGLHRIRSLPGQSVSNIDHTDFRPFLAVFSSSSTLFGDHRLGVVGSGVIVVATQVLVGDDEDDDADDGERAEPGDHADHEQVRAVLEVLHLLVLDAQSLLEVVGIDPRLQACVTTHTHMHTQQVRVGKVQQKQVLQSVNELVVVVLRANGDACNNSMCVSAARRT